MGHISIVSLIMGCHRLCAARCDAETVSRSATGRAKGFTAPHRRLNSPDERVPLPEVDRLSGWMRFIPRLTRSWVSEVSGHDLVIARGSLAQDDCHDVRRLRSTILDEPTRTATTLAFREHDPVARASGYDTGDADGAVILHRIHDGWTPAAVDVGNDLPDEWSYTCMNMRRGPVVDTFTRV